MCRVGGEEENAWVAAEGWAFAYRRDSMHYVAEETAAKVAKRGIWGEVVAPRDWRRGERLRGCSIKGNIAESGTRIYHVPGGAMAAARASSQSGTQYRRARGKRS